MIFINLFFSVCFRKLACAAWCQQLWRSLSVNCKKSWHLFNSERKLQHRNKGSMVFMEKCILSFLKPIKGCSSVVADFTQWNKQQNCMKQQTYSTLHPRLKINCFSQQIVFKLKKVQFSLFFSATNTLLKKSYVDPALILFFCAPCKKKSKR